MKEFIAKLRISPKYKKSEVIVETSDAAFGQELLDHIYRFSPRKSELCLKTSKGMEIISQEQIIYLEVFQREITIYHREGELTVRMPLAKLLEYLDEAIF